MAIIFNHRYNKNQSITVIYSVYLLDMMDPISAMIDLLLDRGKEVFFSHEQTFVFSKTVKGLMTVLSSKV